MDSVQDNKAKKISIKNFSVFKEVETGFSNGLNVFIGENGTGKTIMLKLLDMYGTVTGSFEKEHWYRMYWVMLENAFARTDVDDLSQATIEINDTVVYDISVVDRKYAHFVNIKKDSVFIPSKEMLSLSDITRIHEKYKQEFKIDKTLTAIIQQASFLRPDEIPDLVKSITPKLEKIIGGTVYINPSDSSFWINKANGKQIPFFLEAEGFRKLGLLWQLLMNKVIHENTILLWDEPETNMNPAIIPVVADILLELARLGLQIFIATHDYILAKYIEVRAKESDNVMFHSFYLTAGGVKIENNLNFKDLKKNPIISSYEILMDEVIEGNLGD